MVILVILGHSGHSRTSQHCQNTDSWRLGPAILSKSDESDDILALLRESRESDNSALLRKGVNNGRPRFVKG